MQRGVVSLLVVAAVGLLLVGSPMLLEDYLDRASINGKLDALHGKTGLDPLDPVSPLADAELLGITEEEGFGAWARIRFTYANGVAREYRLPVSHDQGFLKGWRYTGLDRVFAPHEELPDLPFAGRDAPLRIGVPEPISAVQPDLGYGALLGWGSPGLNGSAWSPSGDAVVVRRRRPNEGLWLVPLEQGEPVRLTDQGWNAQWTPDGRSVVYTNGRSLVLTDRSGEVRWSMPVLAQLAEAPDVVGFTVAPDGILLMPRGERVSREDRVVWRLPYDASGPEDLERVMVLPRTDPIPRRRVPLAVSPDGALLAYGCGPDICFADLQQAETRHVDLAEPDRARVGGPEWRPVPEPAAERVYKTDAKPASAYWPDLQMAWSPDGQRLAVVQFGVDYQPRLLVLDRMGNTILDLPVGPNGQLAGPQWTPDGAFIFLQAYPEHGRRIVAVDVAREQVFDLSQPRWDVHFSVSSDGDRLALTNGRGGLWLAPIVWRWESGADPVAAISRSNADSFMQRVDR